MIVNLFNGASAKMDVQKTWTTQNHGVYCLCDCLFVCFSLLIAVVHCPVVHLTDYRYQYFFALNLFDNVDQRFPCVMTINLALVLVLNWTFISYPNSSAILIISLNNNKGVNIDHNCYHKTCIELVKILKIL